jgi:hypothetical protein
MRNVVIVAVVVGILVLLFLGTTLREESDQIAPVAVAPTATQQQVEPVAVQDDKEPWSFDRQTVADLSSKTPGKRERAQWQPKLKLSSPERFGKTLKEAQAATNAADVYNVIFERLQKDPLKSTIEEIWKLLDNGKGTTPERFLGLGDADRQQLLDLLQSNEVQELMALTTEAAGKSECDFELDYSQGFNLLLPHLGPMRNLAKLCGLHMLASTDLEDPESALAMAEIGMQVARDANDDRLLINGLVEIASDRMILESLAAVTQSPDLPAEDAYPLLIEMAKRDYVNGMRSAIKFELEMVRSTVANLVTKTDRQNLLDALEGGSDPEVAKLLDDPDFIPRNIATIEAVTERFLELSELPPEESQKAMAEQLKEVQALPKKDALLASVLLPAYDKVIGRSHRSLVELDNTYVEVLTAVYRSENGRDPQSIEDLQSIIEEANNRAEN